MNNKGLLIVSLDFELFWGMQHICPLEDYRDHILGVWKAIPRMLELFKRTGVHATWAAVGFLFAHSFDEIRKFSPPEALRPTYDDGTRLSYRCLAQYNNACDADCFLALPLIEKIRAADGQEIGCHTFSHYYCLESGQTLAQFEADIQAAVHIAAHNGVMVNSMILPRNQINQQYIAQLARYGFKSYRSEEEDWIHTKINWLPLKRILRLTDVYFPLTGADSYIPQKKDGIWNFPGSRMYKPFFKPLFFLEKLKVFRIKRQMLSAARHNKVFHLWWHPHNIGARTDFHLKQLNEIFSYYQMLHEKYGMQSMNMAEAVEYFEAQPKA